MPLSRERIAELRRLCDESRETLDAPGPLTQRGFEARKAYVSALLECADELVFAAERDADVRVLDEWKGPPRNGRRWETLDYGGCQIWMDGQSRHFGGPDPVAARRAAAQAIEKERET